MYRKKEVLNLNKISVEPKLTIQIKNSLLIHDDRIYAV